MADKNIGKAPALVVLAAGMGSRYGGLKQIDPVGPSGETILEYSVFDAIRAGFEKLVFVIRRDIEDVFKAAIGKKFEGRIRVEYAFQELSAIPKGFQVPPERKKPWGTAHAIIAAKDCIDEPFSVINADDFYGRSAFAIQNEFLRGTDHGSIPEYSLVGYTLRHTLSEYGSVSRGLCRTDSHGYLKQIEELTKIEKDGGNALYQDEHGLMQPIGGDSIVSMNMWGFTPSLFEPLEKGFIEFLKEKGNQPKEEYFITVVINDLIERGLARFRVFASRDSWFGITYPEDKTRVVESIRALTARGEYPKKLW